MRDTHRDSNDDDIRQDARCCSPCTINQTASTLVESNDAISSCRHLVCCVRVNNNQRIRAARARESVNINTIIAAAPSAAVWSTSHSATTIKATLSAVCLSVCIGGEL